MTNSSTPLSSLPGGLTLSERRRLVRSTRKLGDFLGATPKIHAAELGNCELQPVRHLWKDTQIWIHPSRVMLLLLLLLRVLVLLLLPAIPQPFLPSASRQVPNLTLFLPPRRYSFDATIPPPTPTSPSPHPSPSPSPTADTFIKAPLRRVRSFAKISRVLGTNLNMSDFSSQSFNSPSHPPSSWRVVAVPQASAPSSSESLTQGLDDGRSPSTKRRTRKNSLGKLKKRFSSTGTTYRNDSPGEGSHPHPHTHTHTPSSSSSSSSSPFSSPLSSVSPSEKPFPPLPCVETPRMRSARGISSSSGGGGGSSYREEKAWRGEWNRDSIREVIDGLRELRVRA
ncbi:hypothetical protein D9757_012771 [Collybiopsis confluens]|uniref:Uncharacterized protein n=1 Tax=Collybiopsis confluens TaxID=2823264 RepID=A0A8H5GL21_9AGAR|nr:hypothetical protein D9757_012771 [Collybiopsis confluens]